MNFDAEFVVLLDQGFCDRCSTTHHPTQRAGVVFVRVPHRKHVLQHHRHHQGDRDLLVTNQLPRLQWIECLQDRDRRTAIDATEHRVEGPDVEHRQRDQVLVTRLEVSGCNGRQDRPEHRVVRVHHTLRQPRGAAGVHDEDQIVTGADGGWFVGRGRTHPLVVVGHAVDDLAADLNPGRDCGLVTAAAELGRDLGEVGAVDQHRDAGIVEDELEFVSDEAPVQRHVDSADLARREE